MKLVIIESPYAGEHIVENVKYAQQCVLDCLKRGEAPIASHLLYTQVLDDTDPEQRKLGIEAGHAWFRSAVADRIQMGRYKCPNPLIVFYVDRGFSNGMIAALEKIQVEQYNFEIRRIHGEKTSK